MEIIQFLGGTSSEYVANYNDGMIQLKAAKHMSPYQKASPRIGETQRHNIFSIFLVCVGSDDFVFYNWLFLITVTVCKTKSQIIAPPGNIYCQQKPNPYHCSSIIVIILIIVYL